MKDWHPHSLFHCLDSDILAWVTIILCFGVLVGYVAIAVWTWRPSLKAASPVASMALFAMMCIFIFCAVAGYGTVIVAAFAPEWGYILRVIFLALVNVVNAIFLFSKRGQEFKMIGRAQAIGAKFSIQMENVEGMSDRHVAEMSRALAAEFLQRKAERA